MKPLPHGRLGPFVTDQEQFWAGDFGNEYVDRNADAYLVDGNEAFFRRALGRVPFRSCIEFGTNIGNNIVALKKLFPSVEYAGIEINAQAVERLKAIAGLTVFHQSILDFVPQRTWDLAFIKTVLIHINPELLPKAYDALYAASDRYIFISEYYNPTPVEVNYRGHNARLFKRDFAGEMLDRHRDLALVDYGFIYHRDASVTINDDQTWFLLEKRGATAT